MWSKTKALPLLGMLPHKPILSLPGGSVGWCRGGWRKGGHMESPYPSLLMWSSSPQETSPKPSQQSVLFRPRTPKTQPPALATVARVMLCAGQFSLQDMHWPGTSFGGHSSPFWQVLEARDHKWSNRGSNMYQPIKLAAAQSTPWRLGLRAPISLPAAGGRVGGGLPWGTIPE